MREMLFRGKRLDNGEWVEGAFCPKNSEGDIPCIIVYNGTLVGWWFEVDPDTVGQFTGLRDKNGERIFEGDVCRFREWSGGEMCWVGNVHYEHQQFVISGGPNKECDGSFCLQLSRFVSGNIEVIGNIHDNPELLEVTLDEELKPCPFCGGKPRFGRRGSMWAVECRNDYCRVLPETELCATQESAAEIWNRRG